MIDLERLEQLTRLRDSGALTEDEFAQGKAALLVGVETGPKRVQRRAWFIPAIAATVIILAIVAFLATRKTVQEAPTNSVPIARDQVTPISEQPSSIPTQPQSYGVSWATSEAVLGLNPAYIESKLGPAKTKDASSLEYDVEGCGITYSLTGLKVDSVDIKLSAQCHPIVAGQRITEKTTFGELFDYNGNLRISCMGVCGNAYDPPLDYFVPGYHANNFVQYEYSSGDDVGEDAWQASIRLAHGHAADDYAGDNPDWFQCVSNVPLAVQEHAKVAKISSVKFGSWSDCQYQ